MKTFGNAIGCIVSINVILLILLLIKVDVGDIVFSILSGSVVAFLAALLALSKNMQSSKVVMLVFLSILSAMGSWIIATLLLKIMTVSLYSTTALAFDLTVGIIGSITMSALFIEREINNHVTKGSETMIDSGNRQ